MKTRKRLKAIIEAIEGIIKGAEYRKELKKIHALEELIERMEAQRLVLLAEREAAEAAGRKKALKKAERQCEILEAQLKQTRKVLVHQLEKKDRREG